MERYFKLEESPIYKNKFIIQMDYNKFLFPNGTNGSYNVFIARLLNLSYADYLRYARDRLGAELVGKKTKYIIAYYDYNKTTEAFIKLLNARMNFIMNEQEYPFEYKVEDGVVTRIPYKEENEDNN